MTQRAPSTSTNVNWNSPNRTNPNVRLACVDWLDAARSLDAASVDLVYVDPPFNTGRRQVDRAGSFDDAWPTLDAYLDWLNRRLAATARVLKPTGSILLHVDYRVSHRARVLLDDLLGADRFVNHLVWSYGLGGSSPRRFARKHDDILFYCVDPARYWFEAPMVPATSRRMAGQMKKATDVIDLPGLPALPNLNIPPDVIDLPSLNNMASERVGWPTQKPIALLNLLVRACCPPGGVVLDPCCGSGTTLLAAIDSDRLATGADINPQAIDVTTKRLAHSSST